MDAWAPEPAPPDALELLEEPEPPEEPEEPEDTQDPEEPEEPEMWEEPEPTGSHANVNGLAGDAANYGTGCEAEAQLTMPPTEKKKRRVIRRGDIR